MRQSKGLAERGEYEAIEAAVMETARGRWFLAEFARRRCGADTARVLEAIDRLEAEFRAGTGLRLQANPAELLPANCNEDDDLFEPEPHPLFVEGHGAGRPRPATGVHELDAMSFEDKADYFA